ncbi:MAG: dihydrofolate reductase [Leptolyngbyaceae cyanobacterium SL_7_1]|nr:dihydrofolate reductase [Leptolyngbyaceae cyanobacterium SL_7_1]
MNSPEVILIAALAEVDRAIGYQGRLPWHLPEDLARFKRLTLNHTLIMGRKTWELDLKQRPLPQRRMIVLSRSPYLDISTPQQWHDSFEVRVVRSLADAFALAANAERIFIAGGASVYDQTLSLADGLELTLVAGEYPGDAYFPDYKPLIGKEFERINQIERSGYRFESYRRMARTVATA